MEIPDLGDYFRNLARTVTIADRLSCIRMPDRILVVDDEEPIREIIDSMLSAAGYACKQAGSGMEALAVLTSGEEFELMLSDLMMADLDGIGLLGAHQGTLPGHAGGDGYRRARHFRGPGSHSQRRLRLPA